MSVSAIEELKTTRTTDLKTKGWRKVHQLLENDPNGALAITNHQRFEAVLLTVEEYERLQRVANERDRELENLMDTLRTDFDRRLEALNAGDLGQRLRKASKTPIKLGGKVRVGDSF